MTEHVPRRSSLTVLTLACLLALATGIAPGPRAAPGAGAPGPGGAPTAAQAKTFIEDVEKHLLDLGVASDRADWVQQNFITDDTEQIAARAKKDLIAAVTDYALKAKRFDGVELPGELRRRFDLLRLAVELPAPNNPADQTELTDISAGLESAYGKGKYCPPGAGCPDAPGGASGPACLDINDTTRIMATSRDAPKLLDVWRRWHTISPPMRPKYERFARLANKGARELGFSDLGAMWRSNYDMPPEAFAAEVERLWTQVAPLYWSLHAYVRSQLVKQYGAQLVPPAGPIPAHLLGNIWAQQWGNIYPLVAPPGGDPGYDLTEILRDKKVDDLKMVRYGEGFFTSLGFAPLPPTFWERSLFKKPADRDVVCHASAWDIDTQQDLRVKMCIEINDEDFRTIHHELGHNFYQRAYNRQPPMFRGGAPAVTRSESDFDSGAKYHVPANVSYPRYFLADILQFQFHRALCREAGFQGPLHQCSVYDNKAAGRKLQTMLEVGQSRPWPEALYALTGEKQMDATAIIDYFAPLKAWLDQQNKGKKVGV